MPVKHSYTVTGSEDPGSPPLVGKQNWNDDHLIVNPLNASGVDATFRRIIAGGTSLQPSDFSLTSGWGSSAYVSGVSGTDQGWNISVTSSGTGQSQNPGITVVFKDGAFSVPPLGISKMGGGTGLVADLVDTITASSWNLVYQDIPVSGDTYGITGILMGRGS